VAGPITAKVEFYGRIVSQLVLPFGVSAGFHIAAKPPLT
jgi:hypothetical protein